MSHSQRKRIFNRSEYFATYFSRIGEYVTLDFIIAICVFACVFKVEGMPFFAALVVRLADSCVLSRFSNAELEPTVWNDIVTKCQAPKYRTTYLLGGGERTGSEKRLAVHIMTDAFVGFACVSDSTLPRRTGHLFLDELAKVFYKMFVEPPEKLTSTLCASFNSTMKEHITRSSEKLPEDKLQQVRTVVDEVKTIALDNVEKVLQRGTQIDEIVEKTDELQNAAVGFQRQSRNLRNQMWWNNTKGTLVIAGVVTAFLVVVYIVFCGGLSCSSAKKS